MLGDPDQASVCPAVWRSSLSGERKREAEQHLHKTCGRKGSAAKAWMAHLSQDNFFGGWGKEVGKLDHLPAHFEKNACSFI